MLSDIRDLWPKQTGTRTARSDLLLQDLQAPAWWTGVKIDSDSEVQVQLCTEKGPELGSWTQGPGWHPLPWPIPAAMAKAMGMYIQVTGIISITACYHDLPLIDSNDRFLFTRGKSVVHHWNGRQRTWGDPTWRTIHRLVPPMSVLLNGWNDDVFCIHSWDEEVPTP
jgi:hypothetical protein